MVIRFQHKRAALSEQVWRVGHTLAPIIAVGEIGATVSRYDQRIGFSALIGVGIVEDAFHFVVIRAFPMHELRFGSGLGFELRIQIGNLHGRSNLGPIEPRAIPLRGQTGGGVLINERAAVVAELKVKIISRSIAGNRFA